jgi:hypothetical protein
MVNELFLSVVIMHFFFFLQNANFMDSIDRDCQDVIIHLNIPVVFRLKKQCHICMCLYEYMCMCMCMHMCLYTYCIVVPVLGIFLYFVVCELGKKEYL